MQASRIAYPDNPVMAAAWYGLVNFLSRQPEAVAHFEQVSGKRWPFNGNRTAMDKAIDEATGYEADVVDAFIDYVNEWHWGEDPFQAP